jgi:hypothetical protein
MQTHSASKMTAAAPRKDIVMWVSPQETRKTREDAIEEFTCKPCLQNISKGSCGSQMLNLLACLYISRHNNINNCLEDYNQMKSCWQAHPDEYAEFLKDPKLNTQQTQQT